MLDRINLQSPYDIYMSLGILFNETKDYEKTWFCYREARLYTDNQHVIDCNLKFLCNLIDNRKLIELLKDTIHYYRSLHRYDLEKNIQNLLLYYEYDVNIVYDLNNYYKEQFQLEKQYELLQFAHDTQFTVYLEQILLNFYMDNLNKHLQDIIPHIKYILQKEPQFYDCYNILARTLVIFNCNHFLKAFLIGIKYVSQFHNDNLQNTYIIYSNLLLQILHKSFDYNYYLYYAKQCSELETIEFLPPIPQTTKPTEKKKETHWIYL